MEESSNSCKRDRGREGGRVEEGKISFNWEKIIQGRLYVLRFRKETGNKGNECFLNIYHVLDILLGC